MSENVLNDAILSSLSGIKELASVDCVVGNAIHTPAGVTIIPVSKISAGFAGGGVDFTLKKAPTGQNYGTGSGTGISITPIAFLTVDSEARVNLININPNADNAMERIASLIENAPELLQKAKKALK